MNLEHYFLKIQKSYDVASVFGNFYSSFDDSERYEVTNYNDIEKEIDFSISTVESEVLGGEFDSYIAFFVSEISDHNWESIDLDGTIFRNQFLALGFEEYHFEKQILRIETPNEENESLFTIYAVCVDYQLMKELIRLDCLRYIDSYAFPNFLFSFYFCNASKNLIARQSYLEIIDFLYFDFSTIHTHYRSQYNLKEKIYKGPDSIQTKLHYIEI